MYYIFIITVSEKNIKLECIRKVYLVEEWNTEILKTHPKQVYFIIHLEHNFSYVYWKNNKIGEKFVRIHASKIVETKTLSYSNMFQCVSCNSVLEANITLLFC